MLKKGCDIPVIASIPETLPTFLAGVFFSSPFGFVEVFADEVSFFIGTPFLGKSKSSTLVRIEKRRGGNCRCKDSAFISILQVKKRNRRKISKKSYSGA